MSSRFRAALVKSGFRVLDLRCQNFAAAPSLHYGHASWDTRRLADRETYSAEPGSPARGFACVSQGSDVLHLPGNEAEDRPDTVTSESVSGKASRIRGRLSLDDDQVRWSVSEHDLQGVPRRTSPQAKGNVNQERSMPEAGSFRSARLASMPSRSFYTGSGQREFSSASGEGLVVAERAPPLAVSEMVESVAELMTEVEDPKELATAPRNRYFILSEEKRRQFLPDGLPPAMQEEFEVSGCAGVLIRQRALELIARVEAVRVQLADAQRAAAGEGAQGEEGERERKQHGAQRKGLILLEGLRGSGKTFALATAVLWARASGWLVLYVPSARSWVRGGLYYRHPHQAEALWDTPLQARTLLEGFLACHGPLLAELPLQVLEPLSLGEGPGTGRPKGAQEVMPERGWSLKELVGLGATNPHAAVSVVVRLRQELAKVTSVPVLIAIDEYNSWFSFSQFWEATGERSRRALHANELRMVNAFRPMVGAGVDKLANGVVIAATSESIGIGQLPEQLPGVPKKVRFEMSRYSAYEARSAMLFYQREKKVAPDNDNMKRLFFLTNGNGFEIRKLAHII